MNWVALLLEAIATTANIAAKAIEDDWDDAPKRVFEVWKQEQSRAVRAHNTAEAEKKFGPSDEG